MVWSWIDGWTLRIGTRGFGVKPPECRVPKGMGGAMPGSPPPP